MRWLWPDSIAGRVILVLLVGLTISHLVSMTSHYTDLTAQLHANRETQLSERMASVSQAISQAPVADRENLARLRRLARATARGSRRPGGTAAAPGSASTSARAAYRRSVRT